MRALGSPRLCQTKPKKGKLRNLDGQNRQSPIATVQRPRGQLSQALPQFHMERMLHERQSCDSNRGTTNAGSMRTSFCVLEGDMTANER